MISGLWSKGRRISYWFYPMSGEDLSNCIWARWNVAWDWGGDFTLSVSRGTDIQVDEDSRAQIYRVVYGWREKASHVIIELSVKSTTLQEGNTLSWAPLASLQCCNGNGYLAKDCKKPKSESEGSRPKANTKVVHTTHSRTELHEY